MGFHTACTLGRIIVEIRELLLFMMEVADDIGKSLTKWYDLLSILLCLCPSIFNFNL